MNEIKEEEIDIDPEKLVCTKSDGKIFNFNTFKLSFKFASSIYDRKITLEEAKMDQNKMLKQLKDLEKYDPKNRDKMNSRKETLINAEELDNNKDNVIEAFENRVFPFKDGFRKKESGVSDKTWPYWVKVDKNVFGQIKNKVFLANRNNLQASPTGYGKITFLEKASRITGNIENGKDFHEKALKIKVQSIKTSKQLSIKRNLMKIKLK